MYSHVRVFLTCTLLMPGGPYNGRQRGTEGHSCLHAGFSWEGTWVREDGILQPAEVIRGCCTKRSIPENREHTLPLLRPGPASILPLPA